MNHSMSYVVLETGEKSAVEYYGWLGFLSLELSFDSSLPILYFWHQTQDQFHLDHVAVFFAEHSGIFTNQILI